MLLKGLLFFSPVFSVLSVVKKILKKGLRSVVKCSQN